MRMALTWATSPAVPHLLGACPVINRFQRVPVPPRLVPGIASVSSSNSGHPGVRSRSHQACLSETLGLARPTSLMTMCHSTSIVEVQQLWFAAPPVFGQGWGGRQELGYLTGGRSASNTRRETGTFQGVYLPGIPRCLLNLGRISDCSPGLPRRTGCRGTGQGSTTIRPPCGWEPYSAIYHKLRHTHVATCVTSLVWRGRVYDGIWPLSIPRCSVCP